MLAAIYRRRGWERAALVKLQIVDRYQRVVDDPAELDRRADDAIVSGDIDGLLRVIDRARRAGPDRDGARSCVQRARLRAG